MSFVRRFPFFFAGLAAGALIQMPFLLASHKMAAFYVQLVFFVVGAPLALLGFSKPK